MLLSPNQQTLVIHGCGGHARSVADVALTNGIKQIIFIDPMAKENERLFGFPVVKTLSVDIVDVVEVIAIGDNRKRAELFQSLLSTQSTIISLVANSAHLGAECALGKNVFIAAGAHVGPRAVIGNNTIINTHCVVEHDCRVGNHSHISVNAVVAGSSQIGDFVMIGAGATVIDSVKIGANIIVGAGAVVASDLSEPGVYVGVPAKRITSSIQAENSLG